MKKIIFLLLLVTISLCSFSQASRTVTLQAYSYSTSYDKATNTFTWTKFMPCNMKMHIGENFQDITVYGSQTNHFKLLFVKQMDYDKTKLAMVDTEDNFPTDVTFLYLDNATYVLFDFVNTTVMYQYDVR